MSSATSTADHLRQLGGGGQVSCPECGGNMYDNRRTKTKPTQPDFKCKAYRNGCKGVIWPDTERAAAGIEPAQRGDRRGVERSIGYQGLGEGPYSEGPDQYNQAAPQPARQNVGGSPGPLLTPAEESLKPLLLHCLSWALAECEPKYGDVGSTPEAIAAHAHTLFITICRARGIN